MNAGLARALGVMMKLDFQRAILNHIPEMEAFRHREAHSDPSHQQMSDRLSPSEYLRDNFWPSERIAILVLNRTRRETTQRITSAEKAGSSEFQAWLKYKNANGADIYVGMNPLKNNASTRTKDDIETIRQRSGARRNNCT